MVTDERRQHIIQELLLNKRISARELAARFAVSGETIRKDLLYLEKKGIAKKRYGGAVIASGISEAGFMEKAASHPAEKAAIARRAADFVREGAVVFLDSGSTVFEVARRLALRTDVTVFTNSLKAAQCLSDAGVAVSILGGEIRSSSKAVTGGWAARQLAEIRADVAFLGTSGFRGRAGPCVENLPEGDIKRAMLANAYQAVVVADSSKAATDAMAQFASWEEIAALVSDRGLARREAARLGKLTKVIVA